ncbi:uncharacterized protein LOC111690195 isoform X3 [Lucilia cuprina]|uniref:uncharacterized protein LOC111690195 isoform X3 n=1 Tax=Lucilia cuprina TaxID=7375 RepID=UPI001F06FA6E|nr:uncharacterized protein LOC111690195 isoform X3 [Lucilia cuprina]
MSFHNSKPSKGDVTNFGGNTYCVILNIVEGIGFDLNAASNYSIILKVSLNGVLFEVVGKSIKSNFITFNSNCIWECELTDIKRMKSDNRPVKLECHVKYDHYENGFIKRVGSLLLPLRGLKIIHAPENLQEKQINHITNEMAHTKKEIRDRWEGYINQIIARLETKVLKCDKMFEQLEKTQSQLNVIADISLKNATIADNITREMESFYRKKTTQFEMELECLRNEIQVKEIENVLLKKHNDQLEKQLSIYQTCHISIDQLKEVLNDMRNQATRLAAIECFYKRQCFDEMHKWKLKIFKLLNERNFSTNFDVNFNLDELFKEMLTLNSNNFDSFQESSVSCLKCPPGGDFFL